MKVKKIDFFLILLLTILSLYIYQIKKKDTPISDLERFEQMINIYPTYNKDLLIDYYNEYQKENNIVKTLNTINHPNFFNLSIPSYYDKEVTKLILVNPRYYIRSSYIPSNLTIVQNVPKIKRKNETMKLDNDCYNAYIEMVNDAKSKNLNLILYSSYRSYAKQISLYNKEDNSLIARPGHSEHQTGLALDIATISSGLTSHFEHTNEFKYLSENAHKFGFILRYPKDKTNITGYAYEPWHYRYVGKEHAKIIKENNLTLEEYIYTYTIF